MLGLDMANRLIGSGQSDCRSDQVRVKVKCCKSLTPLSLDQQLLNLQDPVLAPYGSPPTANRWLYWVGVLHHCRGVVGIFYSPSWHGGYYIRVVWRSLLKIKHVESLLLVLDNCSYLMESSWQFLTIFGLEEGHY